VKGGMYCVKIVSQKFCKNLTKLIAKLVSPKCTFWGQKRSFWGQIHLFWGVFSAAKFETWNILCIRNKLRQNQIFIFARNLFQLKFRLENLIMSLKRRALVRGNILKTSFLFLTSLLSRVLKGSWGNGLKGNGGKYVNEKWTKKNERKFLTWRVCCRFRLRKWDDYFRVSFGHFFEASIVFLRQLGAGSKIFSSLKPNYHRQTKVKLVQIWKTLLNSSSVWYYPPRI